MASERTTSVPVTDELLRHLDAVHRLALVHGVDLTYPQGGGVRVPSNAAAIRWGLAVLAGGTQAPKRDALRVRRARAAAGLRPSGVAEAAGCTAGHVRAVECGAVPLCSWGLLHAWVAEQEAGR